MPYLLLFHVKNGCVYVPQCYVKHTWPVGIILIQMLRRIVHLHKQAKAISCAYGNEQLRATLEGISLTEE
jgi:hypothetical protein